MGKWHLASDEDENHYETVPVPAERRGGYDDYWMAADVLEFTSHGYGGYIFDKDGNKLEFTGYRTDCLTDYAVRSIEEDEDEKPFFLMVSHIEPHHQNDRADYEGPDGSREQFAGFVPPPDLEPGKGDWERFYPDYLGCCHALDRNFGRVVDALKERGIYDDTMVIYGSDHGCHFRTHADEVAEGGYDDYKRNSFEGTIHVPLLIKGAEFEKGKREEQVVSLLPPDSIQSFWNSRGGRFRRRVILTGRRQSISRSVRALWAAHCAQTGINTWFTLRTAIHGRRAEVRFIRKSICLIWSMTRWKR